MLFATLNPAASTFMSSSSVRYLHIKKHFKLGKIFHSKICCQPETNGKKQSIVQNVLEEHVEAVIGAWTCCMWAYSELIFEYWLKPFIAGISFALLHICPSCSPLLHRACLFSR